MTRKQDRYINRELSWLEFNARVLFEATRSANPLLERLKFIAISGSNLDEFFRVRVGGLEYLVRHQNRSGKSICGRTAVQQLDAIHDRAQRMFNHQYACLEQLEAELARAGLVRIRGAELDHGQLDYLRNRLLPEWLDVISPLAIQAGVPFPLMLGAQLGVLVRLQAGSGLDASVDAAAEREESDYAQDGNTDGSVELAADRFAVLPIGRGLNRFISLKSDNVYSFVLLEEVLARFVNQFFPGQTVLETCYFRLLRNADFQVDDEQSDDLLEDMLDALEQRKTGDCVSLQVSADASDAMVGFLLDQLEVESRELYRAQGPLDLSAMFQLTAIRGYPELKDAPHEAMDVPDVSSSASIFAAISAQDRLLVHPYQTFEPVVDLLESAAEDPHVIAIKQTLYRTSRNSRVVAALARAAEQGKSVTAVVELKARFDEERNISWANKLELAGVDVIHGIRRYKTHAKICLIVRREPDGIRRYVHLGTGNYNEVTANLYSDISLLTCDEQIGADATAFFNAITGFSSPQNLRKLIMAPVDMRNTIVALIRAEATNAARGIPAGITAKLNSLTDKALIDELYLAAARGVKIRLNIRGICCLRPGLAGLSENIEVTSIVGRYLEHARVMHFANSGDPLLYIASADWMERNMDQRIELMTPVEDPECRNALAKMLEIYFDDISNCHHLNSDGSYYPPDEAATTKFSSQQWLAEYARKIAEDQVSVQRAVFIPRRGDLEAP